MSQQKKVTAKKSGRVKQSRLGRGLSALVEVPVVEVSGPETGGETGSNNKSDNQPKGPIATPVHLPSIDAQKGKPGADEGAGEIAGTDGFGALGGRAKSGGRDESRGDHNGMDADKVVVVGGVHIESSGRVHEIAVGLIVANRDQPRRVFDEGALDELAGSIREHGLLQPVVVRRVDAAGVDVAQGKSFELEERSTSAGGIESGERYELIAGERRWRASRLAGLETISAVVRDVDDLVSAQLAIIENVQREDLNVVELAEGYRVLSDRYSMTQEQIAKTVGVSRSSVANITRLLDLPDEVRDLIAQGALSSGHGKVLLSLGLPEKQRKFAARCLKEGWNVRELERACNDDVDGEITPNANRDKLGISTENDRAISVLRDLEQRVGDELGTRVRIRTDKSRTRGRLVIEFYDLDQFDGLLGRFGVKVGG